MLVADLLCGAGGSSTGAARALKKLGLEMELVCLNHWPTAIETHQKNHPDARHYVQDIATVRPHLIVPEGYLDLLMASPTCTHHSVARGGKPTSDQQRSDPWHIITWLTELRVKRIIIENVWEFVGWGPVDPRIGKPIKSRKGEYFDAWIETMRRLGFSLEWHKLNAANYGARTTRSRFILKGRDDKVSIGWAPLTHAKVVDELTLFPTVKPWRAAREIIDWNLKGKSIFTRPRPLAPKTLARIYAGAVKFGWPPILLEKLLREMDRSLRHLVQWSFARRNVPKKKAERALRRKQTREWIERLRVFRVAPVAFAQGGARTTEPLVITLRQHGGAKSISEPIPALAANGNHVGVAEPVVVNMKGRSTSSGIDQPLPTQTAHAAHLFSAEPIILSQHNSGAAKSVGEPLPSIMTGGAGAEGHPGCARPAIVEVESFVLSQGAGGVPRPTSEPVPTILGGGAHALIVPLTQSGGGSTARDVETDPLATITTAKGGEFGLVVPLTHAGGHDRVLDPNNGPLPAITGANRGELAFITAQHGEREGQAPRVHSLDHPAPAIAATGHVDLVEPLDYDILFRMLEPHELAAAMGFNTDEYRYEFAGTKTEQIKQIGNAVSVEMMEAEVLAIMADAAPRRTTTAEVANAMAFPDRLAS